MWRPASDLREQVRRGAGAGRAADRGGGAGELPREVGQGPLVGHLVRSGRTYADPMAALAEAAEALELRVVDTSTATDRTVDLVGRYAGPAAAGRTSG